MSSARGTLTVFLSFSGAGGVERMVLNLLPGLLAAGPSGLAVDLVAVKARNVPRERLPDGVRLLDLALEHSTWAAPALARYLRRERPVALLAAKDRAIRAAILARRLAATDCRVVGRLGTDLSASLEGRSEAARWLRCRPMRWIYTRLDHLVAVSEGVARDTRLITGLPAERVSVVRNPVVTADLLDQAAQAVAHPWLGDSSIPVVMGAGRLTRQKDFATLIRAFAGLRAQRPARLIILGDGQQRGALTALAGDLGVAEHVNLAGHVTNPYAWIAKAALFVLSSAWEGSPNVLTEAVAIGTPVVATDCPSGPRELLADGHYGPLVAVGDDRAMSIAMGRVLEAPPPSQLLRSAAREYTVETSARGYLRALGLEK